MVKLFVNYEKMCVFKDLKDTHKWIKKNKDLYDNDPENLVLLNDEPFEDVILATELEEHHFQCMGCGVVVGFFSEAEQKKIDVGCPECGTVHGVQMGDRASEN